MSPPEHVIETGSSAGVRTFVPHSSSLHPLGSYRVVLWPRMVFVDWLHKELSWYGPSSHVSR
jgi:hypothetical protein